MGENITRVMLEDILLEVLLTTRDGEMVQESMLGLVGVDSTEPGVGMGLATIREWGVTRGAGKDLAMGPDRTRSRVFR